MRWDGLFADLEAQLAQAAWQETEAEAAELTRGEIAGVHLVDRLRGAVGTRLVLRVAGDERLELTLNTVGPSWVGGTDGAGGVLVPLHALTAVENPLTAAVPERSASRKRLGIGAVYRTLSRTRLAVTLSGARGTVLAEGTIDRVGADHLDVAVHARDEHRRARALLGMKVVPFAAVQYVRSAQASEV